MRSASHRKPLILRLVAKILKVCFSNADPGLPPKCVAQPCGVVVHEFPGKNSSGSGAETIYVEIDRISSSALAAAEGQEATQKAAAALFQRGHVQVPPAPAEARRRPLRRVAQPCGIGVHEFPGKISSGRKRKPDD